MLLLLLYNVFGLSIAILFFEKDYQVASVGDVADDWMVMKIYVPSLPYSSNLKISEGIEGLVRSGDDFYNPTEVLHENDTLYVTLKSNQAARDHFFELANAMQTLSDKNAEPLQNGHGKALKLLNSLLKNYVSTHQNYALQYSEFILKPAQNPVFRAQSNYLSIQATQPSPPPEFS